jgi:hypothetical protein
MSEPKRDVDDVIRDALSRAIDKSKDEDTQINFIEEPIDTKIDDNTNDKESVNSNNPDEIIQKELDGSQPIPEPAKIDLSESVTYKPEQIEEINSINANPVKIAAPKKIRNAIPPPEIEISLIQVNTSYKQVSTLVEQLYTTVRKLFSEIPTKEELLMNGMKIVSLVVPAVESISKTGKELKGASKKDLAVAVVNGLVKRVLENNESILTVYNLLIQPHVDDMIESIVDATRHVNNRYEQGNNGRGREQKKSKLACLCI